MLFQDKSVTGLTNKYAGNRSLEKTAQDLFKQSREVEDLYSRR